MPDSEHNSSEGKSLGMDQRISRRDFLNSTLLASGGLLMTPVTPLQLLGRKTTGVATAEWVTTGSPTEILLKY